MIATVDYFIQLFSLSTRNVFDRGLSVNDDDDVLIQDRCQWRHHSPPNKCCSSRRYNISNGSVSTSYSVENLRQNCVISLLEIVFAEHNCSVLNSLFGCSNRVIGSQCVSVCPSNICRTKWRLATKIYRTVCEWWHTHLRFYSKKSRTTKLNVRISQAWHDISPTLPRSFR